MAYVSRVLCGNGHTFSANYSSYYFLRGIYGLTAIEGAPSNVMQVKC